VPVSASVVVLQGFPNKFLYPVDYSKLFDEKCAVDNCSMAVNSLTYVKAMPIHKQNSFLFFLTTYYYLRNCKMKTQT
jgi:hypothetical protein